jgi:hypothetical protein
MTSLRYSAKRVGELVQFDLIRVLLRCVWPRVTHQRLQSHEVTAAFAKKPIRETMPELVRREPPNAGALADAPDHAHERLVARRQLWILAAPLAIVRRHPLLDLDREHMFVKSGCSWRKLARSSSTTSGSSGSQCQCRPFR